MLRIILGFLQYFGINHDDDDDADDYHDGDEDDYEDDDDGVQGYMYIVWAVSMCDDAKVNSLLIRWKFTCLKTNHLWFHSPRVFASV